MFGAFNLKKGADITTFQTAFDAFCEDLQEAGFVTHWRLWQRAYHDGYDADFPDLAILVEVCFKSRAAAEDSWAYIEAAQGPIQGLHMGVNAQLTQSMFVLFEAIP
ncbi:MAG: DUF6614 family protein [Pseudomonadota bacterium]